MCSLAFFIQYILCVLVSIINFVFFNYKFILIEKIISVLFCSFIIFNSFFSILSFNIGLVEKLTA